MSEEFDRFVETVDKLRGENGCPWDKEQTHRSLKPFFVEETYEALQAIDDGDDISLAGELGDVLLQIGLHSRIASEEGRFDINDVCRLITEKLIRRHPHVFSGLKVNGVDEVLTNWEAIKSREKAAATPPSMLDGVPAAMPALLMALEVSKKAAAAGFEWPNIGGVLAKMREEIDELDDALKKDSAEDIEGEIGDLLFTIVNVARWAGSDPEEALRRMVARFRARFKLMEEHAQRQGIKLQDLSFQEWDDAWNQAKQTTA